MTDNKEKKDLAENISEAEEEESTLKENESIEDSNNKDSPKGPDEKIETRLEKAEEEAKNNYDRMLRVSAEFENYKKRATRDMSEFRKYANESLIKELLTVVDNMERAITSAENDENAGNALIAGVDLTIKEILKIFEKYNVKPIESIDRPFDPVFHQAVMQEENDDKPENTVLSELQKGYMIHDRLLRPAMVVVSKQKSKEDNDSNDN